jgi:DNA-directed RNA polymerase specialized sigma24 family protein
MNSGEWGIVLFGDIVRSRDDAPASTAWLEELRARLDQAYMGETLAPFEFTQGDEIQGLLAITADPFRAVLDATLREHRGKRRVPSMRWAVVAGRVDPGRGPATRRTGEAFVRARAALELGSRRNDGLLCRTGDPESDALLDGTAPVLAAIIDGMTDRQRVIARLALVEGLRQADIAERLKIARPTVSVSYARGDVRNLERLLGAVRAIWSQGIARVLAGAAAA